MFFPLEKFFYVERMEFHILLKGQQFGAFAAYVEKKGFATFNDIPCGESVIIEGSGEVGIRQNINCVKSVYLGAFDINSGRKISEKIVNSCSPPY